jgi:mycobactin polyketide synthetase MbtD
VTYRLPDGTVPVLLSSDAPELLRDEAAAVLSYAAQHPGVTPQAIAAMLFRTRLARKHRALAMVTTRDELTSALGAVVDDRAHPAVVRSGTPGKVRKLAYVFPGQGGQRPGMGKLFYESIPAFRDEVDRCDRAFRTLVGESPLNYLLDEDLVVDDCASTVQPALFTQMAGLAAMWRSFGTIPNATIGHSQGEVAAAYVSGAITLPDAVRIIGIRAHAADEFGSGDYAMAVVATDRDTCENVLARCAGWAQLSVVNSPNMVGISGDRATVQGIVDTFSERGMFARVIRVHYPAHTSLIQDLADKVRTVAQRELQHPTFLDTEIDCLGGTLGGPITKDLPVDEYWLWNLRNTVRFDKAITATLALGIDTFVELAEHPTLQLAIQDTLTACTTETDERAAVVVGTSQRAAVDLAEFTRNLALLAVHDLDYPWDCLRAEPDGPAPRPLPDFPNTVMNETPLWLPYDEVLPRRTRRAPATATPRLLTEEWVRLSHRSLMPPRAIGIVDHTGACAELADALCAAAGNIGATARVLDGESPTTADDLDTRVILIPQSPPLDDVAAATQVATFFSRRGWWPQVDPEADTAITECWLVTVGGERVADDAPPDPVHAAASAGFRCLGAEHPGVRFRHLDLDAGFIAPDAATAILTALHTADESELALRKSGLYAKRIVENGTCGTGSAGHTPEHVLIIGGTGQLGLEFCDHFARRNARRITLVSRSGETTAVTQRLQQIRSAASTRIHIAPCDVGDQAAVSQLARQHRDAPADLIVHAAVEYSGAELADVTTEQVDDSLRTKVIGISRVLETFPRTDGCRVVFCSSIAATVGGRGLIVYAAANRMLDAVAHRLRAEGLDCAAVQWGQWAVTFDPAAAGTAKLSPTGLRPMASHDALALGMGRFHGNAIVAAFELDRARSVLQACGRASLLSQLDAQAAEVPEAPVPVAEAGAPHRLRTLVAQAIGVDRAETVDAETPMVALGLDSLQALELRRRVKAEFDHDLEVADLLGGASIAEVLARLSGG